MVRQAARSLLRSPVFTITTIVSLGVGIGACTAVFAVVKALFFAPLPFVEPDRLVEVWSTETPASRQWIDAVAAGRVRDWGRMEFRSLESFAARGSVSLVIEGDVPERVTADVVSGTYFEILGVTARIGRALGPADDRLEAEPVVVLSERLWRERFDGHPGVLGGILRLSGTAHTIVGVMPARIAEGSRVWIPAEPRLADGSGGWFPVGRLRSGATLEDAVLELQQRAAAEVAADSTLHGGMGAVAIPLGQPQRWTGDATLWVLIGTVGVVFLLALTNLTTLFLVRAAERARGAALRLALGATSWRLGAGLLVESAILASAGAALGLLLSFWLKELVRSTLGESFGGSIAPSIDLTAFLFAALLALCAAAIVGLEPLRHLKGLDVRGLLQTGGPTSTLGKPQARTRTVVVAVQVGVTTVLASLLGILSVGYSNFQATDVGFDARRLMIAFPDYEIRPMSEDEQLALGATVAERVARTPGVDAATYWRFGAQSWPPRPEYDAVYEGSTAELTGARLKLSAYYDIGPDFFETLGVALMAGRGFGPQDGPGSPAVGIVSARGAAAWWPGQDPIGRRLKLGEGGEWITIVGVVSGFGELHELGRSWSMELGRGERHMPKLFRPIAQRQPTPEGWQVNGCCYFMMDELVFAARSSGDDPDAVTDALVRESAAFAPDLPFSYAGSLFEFQERGYPGERLRLYRTLVGSVAVIALALALLGIAGMVADGIARRTREIGIRKALGASSLDVTFTTARESLATVAVGLGTAVVAVFVVVRLIGELSMRYRALLADATLGDWRVLTLVSTSILVVTAMSAWLWARRADRIEPAVALRVD
jgi:putative ABC transport system permease protein